MASEMNEDDIEKEIESHEQYKLQSLMARMRIAVPVDANDDGARGAVAAAMPEKPFKRPVLDLPKFDGSIGNWLHFWSHFKKIHEDPRIVNEDKLDYLKHAVEKDWKADHVMSGYPTTAENCEKAFNRLKARFGRDDLLIEYYTRELLSLVLQNVANKGEITSVSELFDKLSAHIRALATLGVTTNSCGIMLYPLVESSLPEEILRTWQRSAAANAAPVEGEGTPDRLEQLLSFLEAEVKSEERISMAVHGFSLQTTTQNRNKLAKSKTKSESEEQPSCSVLLSTEERRKQCIFCEADHDNDECDRAKELSLEARKDVAKNKGCCFKCLRRNHMSRECRAKLKCSWCKGRHVILMCSELGNDRDTTASTRSEPRIEHKIIEQNLASFCNLPDVCLQTLRVKLYSDSKGITIRALIDGGFQRSYIRSDLARLLGYQPIDNVEVTHSLFGAITTESQRHDIFQIRVKRMNEEYACTFQALGKDMICTDVPRVEKNDRFDELSGRDIVLTDSGVKAGNSDNSIGLLIGADVAGKVTTGTKHDLLNGLSVIQTLLGWTVTGKLPAERRDPVSNSVSMFVMEAKISDLWDLDVLGIRDPLLKTENSLREQRAMEKSLQTITFDEKNRGYSVSLPWIEEHASLSQNFQLAEKRLESTVKKLKGVELFDDYCKVFEEWKDDGIIEYWLRVR